MNIQELVNQFRGCIRMEEKVAVWEVAEILATSMEATHDDILTEMAVNVDIVKTEASQRERSAKIKLKIKKNLFWKLNQYDPQN